ncbi:MAG: hypothetical protein ACK5D5_04635 [Bacteroidota bacterium]
MFNKNSIRHLIESNAMGVLTNIINGSHYQRALKAATDSTRQYDRGYMLETCV